MAGTYLTESERSSGTGALLILLVLLLMKSEILWLDTGTLYWLKLKTIESKQSSQLLCLIFKQCVYQTLKHSNQTTIGRADSGTSSWTASSRCPPQCCRARPAPSCRCLPPGWGECSHCGSTPFYKYPTVAHRTLSGADRDLIIEGGRWKDVYTWLEIGQVGLLG